MMIRVRRTALAMGMAAVAAVGATAAGAGVASAATAYDCPPYEVCIFSGDNGEGDRYSKLLNQGGSKLPPDWVNRAGSVFNNTVRTGYVIDARIVDGNVECALSRLTLAPYEKRSLVGTAVYHRSNLIANQPWPDC